MKAHSVTTSYMVVGLFVLLSAGTAFGTGILTDSNSTFSFSGVLMAAEGGDDIADNSSSTPVVLGGSSLPFSDTGTQSTDFGYASSSYFVDISSNFLPALDILELQLDLGVTGGIDGTWNTFGAYTSDLDGSLTAFFEMQDWSATELTVTMLWSLTEQGSGTVSPNVNSIAIRGPLAADFSNQTGFIFESTMDIPDNWDEVSSVSSQDTVNLVAGTYLVEFTSNVNSDGNMAGNGSTSYGIDMGNQVTVWAQNTIDPNGCLAGVPCPALADIDGQNGVDSNDFLLWYQTPVDVTSDGVVDVADQAAMAYLLNLDMVDTDGNGIVDGLAASEVTPGAVAFSAVQLHPAYPNPFNPTTVLSFTLPSSDVVDLAVYDVKGNRIRTLLSGATRVAGRHEVTWNGRDDFGLATGAGVYFYRLGTKEDVQTGRMLLLK